MGRHQVDAAGRKIEECYVDVSGKLVDGEGIGTLG